MVVWCWCGGGGDGGCGGGGGGMVGSVEELMNELTKGEEADASVISVRNFLFRQRSTVSCEGKMGTGFSGL